MIDLKSWGEMLGLRRKRTLKDRVYETAEDVVDSLADTIYPVLSRSRTAAYRGTDRLDRLGDTLAPMIERSGKVAKDTLSKTAMSATAGVTGGIAGLAAAKDAAADLAEDAASTVAATAAASGMAAAGAATGVAGLVGGILSWLWWLTRFIVKTAILVGVAYAGWQWLQSLREQQRWNNAGHTGHSGHAATQPSSTYGTVTTSNMSTTPSVAGAR